MLPLTGIIIPYFIDEETVEPKIIRSINRRANTYQSDSKAQTISPVHHVNSVYLTELE